MRRLRLALLASMLAIASMTASAGATGAATAGFQTFVVQLSPQAPNTEGSGLAVVRINPATDEVCYVITVSGIGAPTEPAGGLGAAHIHDVATRGIFVDLETSWRQTGADRFMTIGCTAASSESLDAILADPSAYFVNIHTTEFPGGALTGLLG
jgi:CHRD domain